MKREQNSMNIYTSLYKQDSLFSTARPLFFRISATVTTVAMAEKSKRQKLAGSVVQKEHTQ
jgi:hypothetical protein